MRCFAFFGQFVVLNLDGSRRAVRRRKSDKMRRQQRAVDRDGSSEEFKQDAVQMLPDGHSASSVYQRLGLTSPNLLDRWKRTRTPKGAASAGGLEVRVRQLEAELRTVERERDILPLEMSIPMRHIVALRFR